MTLLGGMLALLTIFSACNDDNNDIQPNKNVAGFMAVNLVTDQPGVGVALSGNMVGAALPYLGYTGGYVRAYPGERSTDAFAADSHNTLASTTFDYKPQKYYSLFVIGSNGNYKNVVVNDGVDTMNAASGKSYFRFINALADSASVTLKVSNDTAEIFSEDADYGKVSPFMELDSGKVTIAIDGGSKASTERTVDLEGQNAYTFLISGDPNSQEMDDTVQLRYIINGKLTLDSTSSDIGGETE